MLYRTGGSPTGPATACELCRHARLNIEPSPLYGVLRTRSGGLNRHTWGDQDTTDAILMPDTDRRSGRPGRDGVLCPTHETPDSDST